MKAVGALGTVAIALALAAPAGAATWTVRDGGGTCNTVGDMVCGSLAQANTAAGSGDTIAVEPKAGGWSESPTFNQNGLTVENHIAGEARINGTLTFTGGGSFALNRLVVLATSGPALNFTPPAPTGASVTLWSDVLSGSGTGANAAVTGTSPILGGLAITGEHVTIADKAGAAATNVTGLSSTSANFRNSLVTGTVDATTTTNGCSISGPDAAGFVDRANEDFHLRVDSSFRVGGGAQMSGETQTDIEGDPRPGSDWSCGADQFFNHLPGASGFAVPGSAPVGQAIAFGAGGSDPDASRGDAPTQFVWNFGDGSPATETDANAQGLGNTTHAYAAAGSYQVTVAAKDKLGQAGPASAPFTVTITAASGGGGSGGSGGGGGGSGGGGGGSGGGGGGGAGPDTAAPVVSITSPRASQRLKRGRRAPVLRGRASDATGVRAVEIALRRFEGRRCRWYDSRRRAFALGACATPRFFRAVVNDFTWSFTFPRNVVPAVGRYELRVRATDLFGRRTTAFSAKSKTITAFRIVR